MMGLLLNFQVAVALVVLAAVLLLLLRDPSRRRAIFAR